MPRLELDLARLNQQRQSTAELQAQVRELDTQLVQQQAELEAAQRTGQEASVIEELRTRLDDTRAKRKTRIIERREFELDIDRIADELVVNRDPAALAEALDGGQPIALLPMRLETRYLPPRDRPNPNNTPVKLCIRVYPDDLNIIQHTPALTAAEQQAGMQYWQASFANNPTEAERIARDLAAAQGRNRCAWILRTLQPLNLDQQEDTAPEFPDTPTIDARAKQTRALLLPDRWCAIGYAQGRREVFRVWGKRIPDELVLSPDWLGLEADQAEALFEGERAWMVDFAVALEKGMALEVAQSHVDTFLRSRNDARGFNLANDTLERLIIIGLEWTKTADQSAAELAELLAAQRDSQGLGFVPFGTPTNNTEVAPSGYSEAAERSAPPTPQEQALLPSQKDALELLSSAFGFSKDALAAEGIQNAHHAEQRTAMHMLNVLWRGTFGNYLMELWNPYKATEEERLLKTPVLYALRRYATSYLRPAGALPLLRVSKQPYGILPVVGKTYNAAGESAVESGIGKILKVLRPLWEIASRKNVPLLKEGRVEKAREILQTNGWSQTAYYRDESPEIPGGMPPNVQSKQDLMNHLLNAVGISFVISGKEAAFLKTQIGWQQFSIDPPYSAIQLAGVPWVLADKHDKTKEAAFELSFNAVPAPDNYLRQMADRTTDETLLKKYQAGPSLLQILISYSVQLERHDAHQNLLVLTAAAEKITSVTMSHLQYVEPRKEDAIRFEINNPAELASVVVPRLTGDLTLGQYVAQGIDQVQIAVPAGNASLMAKQFLGEIERVTPALRDVSGVKYSLNYLAGCSVGELNYAFRTTLDAFSYRLDAWYGARANRRLEQLREKKPEGVYVGGFAWVENLKADIRPDSEGYILAPSLGQAATAALLRAGFVANQEHGAFNIQLNSQRTRRALDILQGLTRDQPLAALYGYRVERGLRDASLGKLIWPLRLAFPWRPAGNNVNDEPAESVGARDVVDGVALLDAWNTNAVVVRTRLADLIAARGLPAGTTPGDAEWNSVTKVMQEALDVADAVGDLLMAEGVHQIVQGNFERAGAAMAIVDKQSLPIETQVAKTPRGGASYTQRMAIICPSAPDAAWPGDRRSRAEPSLNAWLSQMLGEPGRYQFAARVFRQVEAGQPPVIDQDPVTIDMLELAASPLTVVLAATTSHKPADAGTAETGFRGMLARALGAKIENPANVVGLNILQEGAAGRLGLGHFEALATLLRTLLDKARPATRSDLVVPDDALEEDTTEGEYPGVMTQELRDRADQLIADFNDVGALILASTNATDLLGNLAALEDFVASTAWPQALQLLTDPLHSAEDFAAALAAVAAMLDTKMQSINAPLATEADADGNPKPPTSAQLVKQSIEQIKTLLGKDFPVLPRFTLGGYAADFNASLAAQTQLTLDNPWQVSGWLSKLARVHEGLDRFTGALTAHETLVDISAAQDFAVIQYPHTDKPIWAALPEAWQQSADAAPDPAKLPEEIREYVAAQPGTPLKDINRVVPALALALHAPGGIDPLAEDTSLAALVCDEWAEFIPDAFQTAGISFHYDAPGARPPQSILLALPPSLQQDHWTFEQVLDVLHEAWDLAKLRAVSPKDLEGGIGALLPGNYLPRAYTDTLPSVSLQKALKDALTLSANTTIALGKI